MIDVIIAGSGASAVNAAVPLVEAGLHVVMIDAAVEDDVYKDIIPDGDFDTLRKTDEGQNRYFLGDEFEGIPLGPVRVGAQLTPPRQYLLRGVEKHLPTDAGRFQAFQSLALGGLAAGWGAAVPPFNDRDMEGWPIGRADLETHYKRVADRIGVCGDGGDDLASHCEDGGWLLPPLSGDHNATSIFRRYTSRSEELRSRGLFAGSPRMAICTRPVGEREAFRYQDMEFWGDKNPSVYRPRYTLDELRRHDNFEFMAGHLVRSYTEEEDSVVVEAFPCDGGGGRTLKAARLVLCAGAIGSARIVLRSADAWNTPLPLVSNPYTYVPCLNFGGLGMPDRGYPRHSLTQVMLFFDPDPGKRRLIQGQIYSYRSLLTFKLMKESPLAMTESRRLMQALAWYFVVLGIHHGDHPGRSKRLWLEKVDDDPVLRVKYRRTEGETAERREMEARLLRLMPKLGLLPLKRIDPGHGSSIHYAGTLPMTTKSRRYTTTRSGRLRGTRSVYIADGSVLPDLPAKGLTFTLMANADRIGSHLARSLSR
ncbi:MAG: GMC family oxidoreductase [Candidatus Sumerlaeia bacterium]|nr:GMC family oxidoreductase [Candidatus Sumerlaeia bacterium]